MNSFYISKLMFSCGLIKFAAMPTAQNRVQNRVTVFGRASNA